MTDMTLMKRIADLATEDPLIHQFYTLYLQGKISYVDALAGMILSMKTHNDLLSSTVAHYQNMYPPPIAVAIPIHLTEAGRREVYSCPLCGSGSVDVLEISDLNLNAKEGDLRVVKAAVRLNCLECGHSWKDKRRLF